MPKGKHLSADIRKQIYQKCIVEEVATVEAHKQIFDGNSDLCTLNSLKVLISKLRRMNGGEISQFLAGPTSRKIVAGRKRKYCGEVADKLVELRKQDTSANLKAIVDKYQQHCSDGKSMHAPSRSTLSRLYKRTNLSYKTPQNEVVT